MGVIETRVTNETDGQSAAFDATMFLAILLVASALIAGISNHLTQADETLSFDDMNTFTTRLASATLASTMPNATYIDLRGDEIVRTDVSVLDMVVEELLMLQGGVPESNFEGEGRYNARIDSVLSSLLNEYTFDYVLSGTYLERTLRIGQSFPQTERSAFTSEIFLPDQSEPITITLSIWPCYNVSPSGVNTEP